MKQLVKPLVIAAAVPLVWATLYLVAPLLRGPQAAVDAEVDLHIERARRLLHQYDQSAERLAALKQNLRDLDIDMAPDSQAVDRLLEEYRSILETAEQKLKDQARQHRAARGDLEVRYRSAGGVGDPTPTQTSFGVNLSAMAASVREGMSVRDAILAEQDRLIRDTLAEIDQAVSTTRGDATGAQHPLAQHLNGVVLRFRAAILQRSAWRRRLQTEETRNALADMAIRARQLQIKQQLVDASGVRQNIDALQTQAEEIRRFINVRRNRLDELNKTIADLHRRIDSQRKTADAARQTMERLQDEGVNLVAEDGIETFSAAFNQASTTYRKAVAEAHRLEYGTLTNARIDDSGDWIVGQFVPADPERQIVTQRGLVGYRHDKDTVAGELEGYLITENELNEQIADLQELSLAYAGRAADAGKQIDELRNRAAATFQEFEKHADEADDIVQQAVGALRQSISTLRTAANSASGRNRAAGDRIAGLDQQAKDRSPNKIRSEDNTRVGQINNDLGQTYYLLGSVLYDRFAAASADAELLQTVKDVLGLTSVETALYTDRGDSARQDGIDAVRDAVNQIERSGRDLNHHWTLAAQLGDAHYLLSRFEEQPEPFIQSAIDNFQQAVANRETEPFIQAIVKRKDQLTNR